jgi:hypothetical protein
MAQQKDVNNAESSPRRGILCLGQVGFLFRVGIVADFGDNPKVGAIFQAGSRLENRRKQAWGKSASNPTKRRASLAVK